MGTLRNHHDYVSLHNHSEYSVLDGFATVERLIETAASLDMPALALTDHGTAAGIFAFDAAARSAGIAALRGQEFYLTRGAAICDLAADERAVDDQFHLTVLAASEEGHRNLLMLSSLASLKNFYRYPRITYDWLERYGAGLYVLSGCVGSHINQAILAASYRGSGMTTDRDGDRQRKKTGIAFGQEGMVEAEAIFRWYVEHFPGRFAVELMDHGLPVEQHCLPILLRWAEKYDIPVVASNDAHICRPEEAPLQQMLIAVNTHSSGGDGLASTPGIWLKSGAEMAEIPSFARLLTSDDPRERRVLSHARAIAEQCTFPMPRPGDLLPRFPLPDGETDVMHYLRLLVTRGIIAKYPHARENRSHPAWGRAGYELDVIEKTGFPSYFLVVQDVVAWAKNHGILVGPGRGSAAGSLVAYALDITAVDPLSHGLLFERFLNNERISMPDIDLDFADNRRDEVIRYVERTYGEGHVAQIATFGEFGAKSGIKAVARTMNLPMSAVQKFTDLFEDDLPPFENLTVDAGKLQALLAETPQLREAYETARHLLHIKQQVGTHPSAIVVSRDEIVQHVPLMRVKGSATGLPQVQVNMYGAEALGLLKVDFLGLKTLSVLADAQDAIRRLHDPDFVVQHLTTDDDATYAMLSGGDVFGVFQLEQATSARVTAQVRPTAFRHLVHINALSRPGPIDYLPIYIKRMIGNEKIPYVHPDAIPVLAETYGLPLFQDQVMMLARVLAGYSLGEADSLRKAMGKKIVAEMARNGERFVAGCVEKGIDRRAATDLFAELAKFSGYGFNLAHSTCYSLIGYWTAWLSCHYPAIYFAALMTSEAGDAERIGAIAATCRRRGVVILPPDVNASGVGCTPDSDGRFRLGLSLIRDVGDDARTIVAAAPFTGLTDLMLRVPSLTSKKLVALIDAGACDALDTTINRATMIARAEGIAKSVQRHRAKERAVAKRQSVNLAFDLGAVGSAVPYVATDAQGETAPPFSEHATRIRERAVLGFSFLPSPLQWLADADPTYRDLTTLLDDATLIVRRHDTYSYLLEVEGCVVRSTKTTGEQMFRLTVSDRTGRITEMAVFPDLARTTDPPAPGTIIRGVANLSDFGGSRSLVAVTLAVVTHEAMEREEAARTRHALLDREGAIHLWLASTDELRPTAQFVRVTLLANEATGTVPVLLHTPEGIATLGCGASSAWRGADLLRPVFPLALTVAERSGVRWDGQQFVGAAQNPLY